MLNAVYWKEEVTVYKDELFNNSCSGSSLLEVLLAMAIIAMATPFLYTQISDTNNSLRDMATANEIISLRDPMLNFVRLNQGDWPEVVQIRLADEELDSISEIPTAGFIDKYKINGATVTDIYLAFDLQKDDLRTNQVARHIGDDAAVVGEDGIAYGKSWAVAAPDFKPGNLIYKISRDIDGEDKTKYLHRTSSNEEDKLNVMFRDLNMGGKNIYDIGGVYSKSAEIRNVLTLFLESERLVADTFYFSAGATLDGDKAAFGTMRVTGDISGFRNIYADTLNGNKFTTTGRIITDRATVVNSLNIANDLNLKSDSYRTISGFTGITAHDVITSYISTEEISFYENFGLTISGELLMSTTPPLKIGNWIFPSYTPPSFKELTLSRATVPAAPVSEEFNVIMSSDWQEAMPKEIK